MAAAIASVCSGLGTLNPADEFTVVAFDHEQMWWSPMCVLNLLF